MENNQTVSVRYIVNDVTESISFYKDFLGFEVVMHPAPTFAMLKLNNLRLILSQPSMAGGGGQILPDGQVPKPGGWNRFQIEENDLKSVYNKLKEKGATFKSGMIEGIGGSQVLLQDPSGNLIELFEMKKQG